MNNLAKNIKVRMRALGLTQKELAQLAGITQVTVHKIVSGKIAHSSRIVDIAKALQSEPEWLLYGDSSNGSSGKKPDSSHHSNVENVPFQLHVKKLPVISQVQAGAWSEAIDFRSLGDEVEWEDAPANASDNAFWLRVVGDSMTAQTGVSIPEGHMILVDPDTEAQNGNLVVAKLEGTDEVTFKKLFMDAGQKYLKPLNPNYRPLEINGNCRIVGVVKEAKVKF
jgi:SOS-response transcriptional repressor LexA